MTKVFVFGYPGELGGANTECWHTLRLWRQFHLDVHLIPTWSVDTAWRERLDRLHCVTHVIHPDRIADVPGLPGSITVGFCNREYVALWPKLKELDCKIVWVNCMTFLFEIEKRYFSRYGPVDAMIYQSEFQRHEIESEMLPYGYDPATGHLIRGAFDWKEWKYQPRPHEPGTPFVVGRAARPDLDKWSEKTWSLYSAIDYPVKEAVVLGADHRTLRKLGAPPPWVRCLPPMSIPVERFLAGLHCYLTMNGSARENWPRVGLEALAAGVPVVAENKWGWREMIDHGVTGFLGEDQEELAHNASLLARDEELRREITHAARAKLIHELACPEKLWDQWQSVFRKFEP